MKHEMKMRRRENPRESPETRSSSPARAALHPSPMCSAPSPSSAGNFKPQASLPSLPPSQGPRLSRRRRRRTSPATVLPISTSLHRRRSCPDAVASQPKQPVLA
ncbi:hypothetical protein M0R45_016301 [Rubus argutus]|uniref:Uncharacterized protein n=1 Tax=Rubus argutus TaxID=59490 RepID=A0AAW1XU72_RUBAR